MTAIVLLAYVGFGTFLFYGSSEKPFVRYAARAFAAACAAPGFLWLFFTAVL
jgi:hypothetical protein